MKTAPFFSTIGLWALIATAGPTAPDPSPGLLENWVPVFDGTRRFDTFGGSTDDGTLMLISNPRATEVYVNGVLLVDERGNTIGSPSATLKMRPGDYRIRLSNPFFGVDHEQRVNVPARGTASIEAVLK